MTDQNAGTPAPEEITNARPADAGPASQEPAADVVAPDPAVEAEARKMGWVPEGEWKGDKKPRQFLPADEFLRRGKSIEPIIERRLAEKDREYQERFDRLAKTNEAVRKQLAATHAAEVTQLKNDARYWASKGDLAKFDAANARADKLQKEGPALEPEPAKPATPAQKPDDIFAKDNPWFGTDKTLTRFAIGVSQELANTTPGMTQAENFRLTLAEVKKEFPQKFITAGANGHAAVDGGGTAQAPKNTLFGRLPAEARDQFQRDVKAGVVNLKDSEKWAGWYFQK